MMKRTLLFILILALCLPLLVSCGKRHFVFFDDADTWLYEPIESEYAPNEIVNVKLGKVDGLATLFLVNGVPCELKENHAEYWLFSFRMPREDVTIDFKTYDASITDPDHIALIEAYLTASHFDDGIWVQNYYGKYQSGARVAIMYTGTYNTTFWSETVGSETFYFRMTTRATVLYEVTFYTLEEAYQNGYLTDEDIKTVHELHKQAYPTLYIE